MKNDSKTKRPPSKPSASVAPTSGVTPSIEISDTTNGWFQRIVCGSAVGQWTGYQGIALLKVGDVTYRAASDYFVGSLPTNKVFTTKEV